jgi:hypothetical protein
MVLKEFHCQKKQQRYIPKEPEKRKDIASELSAFSLFS